MFTSKMNMFCEKYIETRDKTAAATAAGYAPNTAEKKADELLAREDIREHIAELETRQKEQLVFTADTITLRYIDIYKACSRLVPKLVWDSQKHAYTPSEDIFEMVDAKNALAALDAIAKRLNLSDGKVSSETVKKLFMALEAAENDN